MVQQVGIHNTGQVNQLEKVQRRTTRFPDRNYYDRSNPRKRYGNGQGAQMVALGHQKGEYHTYAALKNSISYCCRYIRAIPDSERLESKESTYCPSTTIKDRRIQGILLSEDLDWNRLPAAAANEGSQEECRLQLGRLTHAQSGME